MSFQAAFMEILKTRYLEIFGDREFGGSESKTQAPYYLRNLDDNLCIPMSEKHRKRYSEADGNELESKMKSLRSSSAMTFNLLGNDPVMIKKDALFPMGQYDVTFEHQLPTLKNSPRKANLDALLRSFDDSIEIYCEMKLAEWLFNNASKLRKPYLDAKNYLVPENDAKLIKSMFHELCLDTIHETESLIPKLNRYDAFQMLKHALAIYSNCYDRKTNGRPVPSDLFLVNCVWEVVHLDILERYESKYLSLLTEEHDQFEKFKKIVNPLDELFEKLGIRFHLEYISFSNFLTMLDLKSEHVQNLQRYIV